MSKGLCLIATTCTTAGSKSKHCTRCSATTGATTIAATGHSYSGKVVGQASFARAYGGVMITYVTSAPNVELYVAASMIYHDHSAYLYPSNSNATSLGTRTQMILLSSTPDANGLFHYRISKTIASAGTHYFLMWENCDSDQWFKGYWAGTITRYTCKNCSTYYDVNDKANQ